MDVQLVANAQAEVQPCVVQNGPKNPCRLCIYGIKSVTGFQPGTCPVAVFVDKCVALQ